MVYDPGNYSTSLFIDLLVVRNENSLITTRLFIYLLIQSKSRYLRYQLYFEFNVSSVVTWTRTG